MTPPFRSPGAPPGLELASLSAAVLCGGRSTRFGADKALVEVGGIALLERVLASLAAARERLVVGRDYAIAGARSVADLRSGLGPLAGLETALASATAPWVAVAACDLPCLTPSYWQLLCDHAKPDADAVVVRDHAGRFEPLAALYQRGVLPRVRARLDTGSRDLQGLLGEVRTVAVAITEVEETCGRAVLRNVNLPDDLTGSPCGS